VAINPDIFKHPRYYLLVTFNTDGNGNRVDPDFPDGPELIERARRLVNAPQRQVQVDIEQKMGDVPDATVTDLFDEIVQFLRKGISTFYLAGGFIQDPTTAGLPPIFWSDDETSSGTNTLEHASAITNPNFYADGISWLREADDANFQRSRFAVTRTWIGGPLGHWEEKLYDASLPIPT
jgi:hypothetical protein